MATDTAVFPNVQIQGNLAVAGNLPTYPRSSLATDTNQILPLPFDIWRVWDSVGTVLPATSATDDLGYYTGTHGTAGSYIGTSDLKSAGATTRYARCLKVLPPSYVAAATVTVRFSAGCITTIADTAATLIVDVRKVSRDRTVGANLYAGAAVSIRSLTLAETPFALTSSGLLPGDMLDIKAAIAVTDAGTGTAVIGAWAAAELYTSIQG